MHLLKNRAVSASPQPDAQLTIVQRRAAYEADRQERKLLHKQRVELARAYVRERLEEWKASENFIQQVIVKVLRAAKLSGDELAVGCEVSDEMFEVCCEQVKQEYYMSAIDAELVRNIGSLSVREDGKVFQREPQLLKGIAKAVVNKCTAKELFHAEAEGYSAMFSHACKQLIDSGSPSVMCPICMDPLVQVSDSGKLDLSSMWCAPLRKTEHWSNHACGHAFCRSCMERWAETAVNEQKVRIKCPAEACSYSLWEQDLKELLGEGSLFRRYQEHKHADYLENLRRISDKDDSLMHWLRSHARPCPDCHVIVSRSEGCNTMTCVCGTRFCYACGCQPCQCNSRGARINIWKPEA